MEKQKFNIELLEQELQKFPSVILQSKPDKINRESIIEFICNCGNKHTKIFRSIVEQNGFRCKKCSEILRQELKKKNKLRKIWKRTSYTKR